MIVATYVVAATMLVLAAIFLMLYGAYGRGWNDHAQRRAEAARRLLAKMPIQPLI